MADAPTRFPWMREQIAKYQDVTAQTFSQGKYARPAPRTGGELFQSFLRHAGHMLWSIPSSLAEGTINWLDYPQKGHAIGSPMADLEVTRGREDYRPSHMGAPEVLAPLGMGVGGALAQLGKSGTQLGVFGGRVAARNLARSGKTTAKDALDMAQAMERQGFSPDEIRAATNEMIARSPEAHELGGVHKGADNEWKFEVTTHRWRVGEFGTDGQLGRGLEAPYLYEMYPALRRLPVHEHRGRGGVYDPDSNTIGLGRANPDKLGVTLHEVQHAGPQEFEKGFGQGTNPAEARRFTTPIPKAEKEVLQQAVALENLALDATMDRRRVVMPDEVARILGHKYDGKPIDPRAIAIAMNPARMADARERLAMSSPIEAYWRHAGEAEARNVAKRREMTAAERREMHPEATEDVPRRKQIVVKESRWRVPSRALGTPVGGAPAGLKLEERRKFTAPNKSIVTAKYDVLGPDGNKIADLNAAYFPATREFKIHMIQVVGVEEGMSANVLSPRQLRQLMREIRRHFPEAEVLSGYRISGFRGRRPGDQVDVLTDEEGLTRFPIPRNFKSETGLPPLELLPNNETRESKEGKQKTPPEAKEPAKKKEDPRGDEPLELEREPDVWLDEEGRPNIRIRPRERQSQLRPWQADRHATRNVIRRVKVVEVDDKPEIQEVTVEGLADEEIKLGLRGQPHGLTGNPRKGAVGYLFAANGRPDEGFLYGLEHPEDRVKDAKEGESHQYAAKGQRMAILKNGNLQHHTPKGRLYINSDA